jgi:hypothetical protein
VANTFIKIASNTVGSGGVSSVTFSSIPQTYAHLIIKASVRTSNTGVNDALAIRLNNSTSNYTSRDLTYDGGGLASYTNLFNAGYVINTEGGGNTANTFSNQEIYIPNYAGSTHKTYSSDSVVENFATDARVEMMATVWADTSAITSIVINIFTGSTIVQNSTFTLYGIKNS